jgi:membrane peptidoglycan carboxypeptidase
VEAASETYFNKKATDLTIAESAYLASLPQAPSYYNPSGPHFDALIARQQYILGQMKELKYITDEQYKEAMNEDVQFEKITNSIKAAHFVQYVQDYLAEKYGEKTLEEGGLKVYTTLDPKLQEIAEKAVSEGAAKNIASGGYNAALVAMDPKTGQILAMVGSKDYFGDNYPANCNPKTCLFSPNVNIATTLQQPGSSFKPYAYVTAFGRDFKYSPSSMLVDVKTDFGNGYSPNNFNLSSNGPVSMRKALAGSLNVPAVKTIALVGPDKVIETARKVGISSKFEDCGLALVLGGCDITLIDHTSGYATLANKGRHEERTSILKILNQDGSTLEEYKEKGEQVLDEQAVYEVTSIMSDNNARSYVFGSNSPLQLGERPVAAKTGTTQDFKDGWTMGFTPSLVAGVWTGNNNNAPMKKDAVVMAGPIWNQFMKEALAGTPIEKFDQPDGIKTVTVDALSGKLPTQYTEETRSDIFAEWAVPTTYDDIHVPVKIDSLTGQPATDLTPPDQITTEIYKVLHSEKPKSPNWENPVIAWALANGYKYPPGSGIENPPSGNGQVTITAPTDNAVITKLPVNVNVNAQGDNIVRVDISVDGTFTTSLNSSPYKTSLNKKYNDGEHTITAKVVYADGTSATDSVTVSYSLNGGLDLSISGGGNDFPLDLTAESPAQYKNVVFYYQQGGTSTVIGSGTASNFNGKFQYSFTWGSPPPSGSYTIYAKSNTGVVSDKVSITVP